MTDLRPPDEYLIPAIDIPQHGYISIGENGNKRSKWRGYQL